MKKTLTVKEWEVLEPELQRLYFRDGDKYKLVEAVDSVAPEILALLAGLLLIRWTGRRYEVDTGTGPIAISADVIRNRVKFISKEFGIEMAQSFRTALATGDAGTVAAWLSDTRGRLRYWHETFFRLPFGASPDAQTNELIAETLRRHLRKHDLFWQGLTRDILAGNLDRMPQRIAMHGRATYTAYQNAERVFQILQGMGEERRKLGIAEHCTDCVEYAARGWQRIGTLPEIGESICLTNCRCYFEYRSGNRAQTAAA